MQQIINRVLSLIIPVVLLFSCSTTKRTTQAATATISRVKYIDTDEIPFDLKYRNTVVGGLSGIDYDAANDIYYLVSDDRSDKNPARFYAAKIKLGQYKIDTVFFTDVKYMLQPNGETYPDKNRNRFKNPDPEAMRYNPLTHQLIWSSEGERNIKAGDTVLVDPAINVVRTDGTYADSFTLPLNLKMHATEKGPRRNGVLEGMTFADNYKTLLVSVEEPLYEDGPRADTIDNNAFIRICKFSVDSKKSLAQYAYKLEPAAYAPRPVNAFFVNGVPDILDLGNNTLLVIERSFSTGRLACTIKLFIADLAGADDVSGLALKGNTSFIPATKKLLLNMDDLGMYTDNIEGVTFGPVLPNGHKSLVFIADNNFSPLEKAQVLLFEVIE